MKKDKAREKRLKRQLISGGVYIALSAVVVAVTVNTVVSLVSDKMTDLPQVPNPINTSLPEIDEFQFDTNLYNYTENLTLPQQNQTPDLTVSDTVPGVDALITEFSSEEENDVSQLLSSETFVGFESFIKPCDGFVVKAQSIDVPVYSETLYDYRTHTGIDIACDKGNPVKACIGGVVSEIYDDKLLGTTVIIKTKDGKTIKYSNLSPELDAGIAIGTIVETGVIIGGVGETALSEAAEAPHLHLEIYDTDNTPLDPEELISF